VNIETYAADHLSPVLYFDLTFVVPVARLFNVNSAASVCNAPKKINSLFTF